MIEPSISTALIEIADHETLALALGSATTTSYTNFRTVRPNLYPVPEDYLGNIALVATINGARTPNGDPVPAVVIMENARVNQVQDISFVDKNETVMNVTIVAHALAEDAFSIPMYVILPKLDGMGYY